MKKIIIWAAELSVVMFDLHLAHHISRMNRNQLNPTHMNEIYKTYAVATFLWARWPERFYSNIRG